MATPQSEPNLNKVSQRIISPFAQASSAVRHQNPKSRSSLPLWITTIILLIVISGIAYYFSSKYLQDPYRTLELFPVEKYLSDYHSLQGEKFKADLRVVNDLGWNENVGRLMVFATGMDSRPIVVLIPLKLSGIYFTKDQTYRASLEVDDKGLIYANTCEKE